MSTEFVIDINNSPTKVYMQIGFFNHKDISFPLQEGDVLCVPANMLHQYQSFEKNSKRISFFVDCENHPKIVSKITFSKPVLSLLCNEIQEYVLTGKDNKLKPLLSYICCDFFIEKTKKTLSPITNRELIIDDFFREKYSSNVTVGDLAKELMLSNKQTEREIKRITGNTFIGELSKRRMNAAIMLSQTTNLSLTKISELVGYSSYSGFYKAYKRTLK